MLDKSSPTKSLPRAQSTRIPDGYSNSPGPSPPRPICPTTRPAVRSTTRITCWRAKFRYARSPQVSTPMISPEGTPTGHAIVILSSTTAGRPCASTAYGCLGPAQAVSSAAPSSHKPTNCRWEPTMKDLRGERAREPSARCARPHRRRVVRIVTRPSRPARVGNLRRRKFSLQHTDGADSLRTHRCTVFRPGLSGVSILRSWIYEDQRPQQQSGRHTHPGTGPPKRTTSGRCLRRSGRGSECVQRVIHAIRPERSRPRRPRPARARGPLHQRRSCVRPAPSR